MNWNNLKRSKCPKCNAGSTTSIPFNHNRETDILSCKKCDFKISQEKYKEIVSGIITSELSK